MDRNTLIGIVLIIGIGIVTVPAGLVATALTKARVLEEEERKKAPHKVRG